jgi:glycosyltransferase involved in cell wall biosynthesis
MIELSVVIPIMNEAPNLVDLHREITACLEPWGRSYEVIIVDDGSTDESFQVLSRIQASDARWRIIRFRRNFGQTLPSRLASLTPGGVSSRPPTAISRTIPKTSRRW